MNRQPADEPQSNDPRTFASTPSGQTTPHDSAHRPTASSNLSSPPSHESMVTRAYSMLESTSKDEAPAIPSSLTSSPPSDEPVAGKAFSNHASASKDNILASPSSFTDPQSTHSPEPSTQPDSLSPDASSTTDPSLTRENLPKDDASAVPQSPTSPIAFNTSAAAASASLIYPFPPKADAVAPSTSETPTGHKVTQPLVGTPQTAVILSSLLELLIWT